MTCGRTCSTCVWWSNEQPALATGSRRAAGADAEIGACTFGPPIVIRQAGIHGSYFPETLSSRGCGKWAAGNGGGPDDGEHVGPDGEVDSTVIPFRKAA